MGNSAGQHVSAYAEKGIDVEVEELLTKVATPCAVNYSYSVDIDLATADWDLAAGRVTDIDINVDDTEAEGFRGVNVLFNSTSFSDPFLLPLFYFWFSSFLTLSSDAFGNEQVALENGDAINVFAQLDAYFVLCHLG